MKQLVLAPMLACAVILLSGCPDSKLPTPTPSVPTPKANTAARQPMPASVAMNQHLIAMQVSAIRS